MTAWLSIGAAFLTQEMISINSALAYAYQAHYDFRLIVLLFASTSAFVIGVGYGAGKWARHHLKGSRIAARAETQARELERALGAKGSGAMLMFLGAVSFNYLNAFAASWLSLPFRTVFVYLLIGDLLWFTTALALVFGVSTVVPSSYALYIVAAASILFAATLFYAQRLVLRTVIAH